MNLTESKSTSIHQTLKSKITRLESPQAEIFEPLLSVVCSPNDISSMIWSEESSSETISSASDNDSKQTSKNANLKRSTINYEEQNKSKRIKIIVISIITLLILVVIAMTITLAILLKSQNSTNEATTSITTGNLNPYSGTTASTRTPIIYDVGGGGASGGPPCSSHTVVNDPLRNVGTPGIGGSCDNGPLFNTSIGGRWIRFVGAGGTLMPHTSPGTNHCGAFLSGWFNGTLPSIIGKIVGGAVYFQLYDIAAGNYIASASVVNCGSFYVYFLPPVILCNARYCTI